MLTEDGLILEVDEATDESIVEGDGVLTRKLTAALDRHEFARRFDSEDEEDGA